MASNKTADDNLVSELIERVFLSRNYAHLSHWKTRSYAEHMALGEFYETIIEDVDSFIEKYQAAFGLIRDQREEKEDKEETEEDDILSCLQSDVKWINANRSKICRNVPALENVLDELVGSYLETIYKLKFLS